MAIIDRSQIKSAYLTKEIPVEGIGVFRIRELSTAMAIKFIGKEEKDLEKNYMLACEVCLDVLIDEQGDRLFKPGEADELAKTLPMQTVERICTEAVNLSGLTAEQQDDTKKNSLNGSGGMSTESPMPSEKSILTKS